MASNINGVANEEEKKLTEITEEDRKKLAASMGNKTQNNADANGHLGDEDGIIIAGDETAEQLMRNKDLAELQKRFSHRLVQQVIYRGFLLNKTVTPEGLDAAIKELLRPGDCLVCGYPKSGTTWLQEVAYLVQNKGDIEAAKAKPSYRRIPFWEDNRFEKLRQYLPSPRTLKTHLPYNFLGSCEETKTKILFIVRNPKDVVVSYFYFYQSLSELNNFQGTWTEFLEMFMEGYLWYMDWFTYITSWWQQRHRDNILFISYEQMKANPENSVREIVEFIHGGPDALDSTTIKAITEHTSFKAMKENPSTNFANINEIRLPFMRKGEVGDWKNHFTVAQSEAFDELIKQKITDPDLLEFIQKNTR